MQSHVQKYAAYIQIYASFCICGIIFAYAIPLHVGKYVTCGFWQNMRSHAIKYSHITGIPIQLFVANIFTYIARRL